MTGCSLAAFRSVTWRLSCVLPFGRLRAAAGGAVGVARRLDRPGSEVATGIDSLGVAWLKRRLRTAQAAAHLPPGCVDRRLVELVGRGRPDGAVLALPFLHTGPRLIRPGLPVACCLGSAVGRRIRTGGFGGRHPWLGARKQPRYRLRIPVQPMARGRSSVRAGVAIGPTATNSPRMPPPLHAGENRGATKIVSPRASAPPFAGSLTQYGLVSNATAAAPRLFPAEPRGRGRTERARAKSGHHHRFAADEARELLQPRRDTVAGQRRGSPSSRSTRRCRSTLSGVRGSTPGCEADTM